MIVKIKTPYIELDSLLKYASICMTGGEAKILIKEGNVLLNGEICTMRKKKIYPNDTVCVDGKEITVCI